MAGGSWFVVAFGDFPSGCYVEDVFDFEPASGTAQIFACEGGWECDGVVTHLLPSMSFWAASSTPAM